VRPASSFRSLSFHAAGSDPAATLLDQAPSLTLLTEPSLRADVAAMLLDWGGLVVFLASFVDLH